MLNFRLNPQTKQLSKSSTPLEHPFSKPLKYNKRNNKIIESHSCSGNVYLDTGRIFTTEQADKIIKDFYKEPFHVRAKKFIKSLVKNIFNKEK